MEALLEDDDLSPAEIPKPPRWVGNVIPDWLERRPEVSSTEKRIYAYLLRRCRSLGYAWPKQKTIVLALGLTLNQVKKSVGRLKVLELIRTQRVTSSGTETHYTVLQHPWMAKAKTCRDREPEWP
jgi:hypothetical protein